MLPTSTPPVPASELCAHYRAMPESKRCPDYLDGGTCRRPDAFVCVVWLERRGVHLAPSCRPKGAPQRAARRGVGGAPAQGLAARSVTADAPAHTNDSALPNITMLVRERERVLTQLKALEARRRELDEALLAHLTQQDEVTVDGVRYRALETRKRRYPLERTLAMLGEATGRSRDDLARRVTRVQPAGLRRVLKRYEQTHGWAYKRMLQVALAAAAKERVVPMVWAQPVKEKGKAP